MAVYLDQFSLPVHKEEGIIQRVMFQNAGTLGYIDHPYPCGIFPQKELETIFFRPITIFYGGNGSGKSTLLNLIAAKAQLKRIAPHNSGEAFDLYADMCKIGLGFDDEGEKLSIPTESRIITSDDIFDFMLTMRTCNEDITEAKEQAK